MAERHAPPPSPTRADGLERLLETERRLEGRLADALAQAREIRGDAERRAAERGGQDGAEAEHAVDELARRIAAERDTECAAARDDARRARARYAELELDADRLDGVADELLRVLRDDEAAGP